MSDQWETYVTLVDDEPAAILVDLGIDESSPDAERPVLLTMRLYMLSPTEEGFASDDEEPRLVQIEDGFIDSVELTTSAVLVGRITTGGWREFFFYAKTSEGFVESIEEAMEAHEEYTYEIDEQQDEEWSVYFELLFPGEEDFQQIYNRQKIEQLMDEGDSLEVERTVDHSATFQSAEDRQAFVSAISESGYQVAQEKFDENTENERPYGVILKRNHAIDWDTIDTVTLELFEQARNFQGEYEGWESPTVTG